MFSGHFKPHREHCCAARRADWRARVEVGEGEALRMKIRRVEKTWLRYTGSSTVGEVPNYSVNYHTVTHTVHLASERVDSWRVTALRNVPI